MGDRSNPGLLPDIALARSERRHELRLSGSDVSAYIAGLNGNLPPQLFQIKSLNFLEISGTVLTEIGPLLGNLVHLTNLSLYGNHISAISSEIGKLSKLKYLDMSNNRLESLPSELALLADLQVLNVSQNQLTDLPDLSNTHLGHLNASYNALCDFPEWLTSSKLEKLCDINFEHNQIVDIPIGIAPLPSLKQVNLEFNKISVVNAELGEGPKLKELLLKGNKLKDNRLRKLVEGKPKSVMEYIRKNCPRLPKQKQSQSAAGAVGHPGGSGETSNGAPGESEDLIEQSKTDAIIVRGSSDLLITMLDVVMKVRPHLVCCVVRHLDLSDEKKKKFISLQTKLHDTLCEKRVAATIATHDLKSFKFPLMFCARSPDEILMQPLNRTRDMSAREYVNILKDEAEKRRKELKRTSYSGVHQYLNLVRSWNRYPCLVDTEDTVISLPPITNSNVTRITNETRDILIEVSSSKSLAVCKSVMDKLLLEMLKLDLGRLQPPDPLGPEFPTLPSGDLAKPLLEILEGLDLDDVSVGRVLVVEQGRVLTQDENLRVAYPSKIDLQDLADVQVYRKFTRS